MTRGRYEETPGSAGGDGGVVGGELEVDPHPLGGPRPRPLVHPRSRPRSRPGGDVPLEAPPGRLDVPGELDALGDLVAAEPFRRHAAAGRLLSAGAPEAAEGGGPQENLTDVYGVGGLRHRPGVDGGGHSEEGEVLYRRLRPDLRQQPHHPGVDLLFCQLHQGPVAPGRRHQEELVELKLPPGGAAVGEGDEPVAVSLGVVEHVRPRWIEGRERRAFYIRVISHWLGLMVKRLTKEISHSNFLRYFIAIIIYEKS